MNFLMKKWMKTSQVLGKLAWKDTTLDEMMAFIGVIFNMGNVKKNQIRDYWSKNELLETPWFGKVMSRGRFELLYSCFSLIDDSNLVPSSHPDYNPTARFEKLIEHVNNKFIYYYKPTQNLTVDESLVCLKNRTRLRQYMPQKHHGRFGVKLWMLCESKTGYCLRMKPYKGKLSPIIKSLSYDVPMNLLQESSLLGKGYHLITDNFFTSINLAKDLLDSHTYLTGTIRTNRKGLPKTLKSAKLGVDESLYMVNNNLLALAYKEKKSKPPVKFLSTFCDASSGKKKVSDQRDYPQMKICYDSYMGGVDLNDQMLYTYMDERKGRKFYRKVILNIFHRAFLNSFILYEQHTKDNPKLSRRAFNYSVINELVKNHLKPPVLPSTSQEVLEKLPEKRENQPSVNLPEFGDIHLLLYADDIAIIGESRMNLQKKIKILKEYLDENLMTLNESKSKIMVFRNGVKLQILKEIEVEKKKKTDVAQKHNIPQSSLSTIIKNSEKIHQQALHAGESSRKRARGSTYADVDFDSYADADNDVVTNAMLSDVEIVESILQAKEEEETDQVDEEVDPIVHIPHPKEVLESIQTLRLFLQCQDESKSLHRHLSDLDNIEKSVQHLLLTSKCQKKITNYFSKNT
ncbi:hypothetical protein LAZ67_8002424 [Cordylochernes scorpioides]|uniref:PiggyBac transposable element-derived protein domain-containing protein n=1 Tax=Cordylochernes scorpioides TaxID=51811 RepID=A0ABY6KQX4_9ARAC|nr:hypothetical protein LAZ67_8002424 [Cordylochernes scorpioides]